MPAEPAPAAQRAAVATRDRVVLAAACAGACLVALALSIPDRYGVTWEEITNIQEFFDAVWKTRSLAEFPYPLLSLVPMGVAWVAGTPGWIVLCCLCLSATAWLLATYAWARGRPATVAYWFLGCNVAVGPIVLTRLEGPLSLLLVACLLASSPTVRGVLLGAAVWTKAWPVVLAAAVLRGDRRAWLACAGVLVGVLVVSVVAFVSPLAWLGGQSDRSLQIEALAATPFVVLATVSSRWQILLRGGLENAWSVVGPGTGAVASVTTLLVLLTLVAAAALCWRRRVWSQDRTESATVLLVLASFCLAPVLSPQFLMSIVAVTAAVSVARDRLPAGWPLLLGACLLTQAVFPWSYIGLLEGALWPVALLVARQALLVAFAVTWVRTAFPRRGGAGGAAAAGRA